MDNPARQKIPIGWENDKELMAALLKVYGRHELDLYLAVISYRAERQTFSAIRDSIILEAAGGRKARKNE
ncbi:MAG: hypothetical protein NT091_01005 [Candidatus Falkowbacteria bacterium]|nr:hypothetical protein [Candidatus Falkowbacteria bacterium]